MILGVMMTGSACGRQGACPQRWDSVLALGAVLATSSQGTACACASAELRHLTGSDMIRPTPVLPPTGMGPPGMMGPPPGMMGGPRGPPGHFMGPPPGAAGFAVLAAGLVLLF